MSGNSDTLGKFRLVHHIATGGMAEVFKAVYEVADGIEKTCVVKRLLPNLAKNPEFIEMFRDEARVSMGISHANFVQVFDFGNADNEYFLAMEYVRGQNLGTILKRTLRGGKLLPRDVGFYVCSEVARGLHYVHTLTDATGKPLDIVHRDIAPDNILVSYEGDVKVADFGIAKAAITVNKTQAGFVKGKASYLAPEQILGADIDARADVFALGAVLWEMLTGRRLFSGQNELEIINKVCTQPITPPSQVGPKLTPEFDAVVMKALERNPNARYPSAAAFREAMEALAAKYNSQLSASKTGEYVSMLFRDEMDDEGGQAYTTSSEPSMVPNDSTAARIYEPPPHEPSSPSVPNLSARTPTRNRSLGTGPQRRHARRTSPLLRLALLLVLVLVAGGWAAYAGYIPIERIPGLSALRGEASPTPEATPTPVAHTTPKKRRRKRRPTPKPTVEVAASEQPTQSATTAATEVANVTPTEPEVDESIDAVATGALQIDSTPKGKIFVDGVDIELTTPTDRLEVPVGEYEIRVLNEEQGLQARKLVIVSAGETIREHLQLTPLE